MEYDRRLTCSVRVTGYNPRRQDRNGRAANRQILGDILLTDNIEPRRPVLIS